MYMHNNHNNGIMAIGNKDLRKTIREDETGARRDHRGSVGDANSHDTLEEIVLLTPGNNRETGTKIIGNSPEEAGNKILTNHRAL